MKKLLKLLLIRENEKNLVFYFLLLFFVIGTGMAMGRASADTLFFKRFGIEYLPQMYVALGILLAISSMIYAAYADRLPAEKFYLRLFTIILVLLIATWLLIKHSEASFAYPMYYLLYETASEILLVHGALYISQNLDTIKSKRLVPIILAGGQLGLITGGLIVALIAPVIGTEQIIFLWIAMLTLASIMIISWHKLKGPSAYFYAKHKNSSLKHSIQIIKQGITFSRNSQLLRVSSYAFFFLVISFYTLYYLINKIYTEHFVDEAELTAFFGLLTAVNSTIALLTQVFITNKLIDKIGVRKTNLIFPLTTSLSFAGLLFFFSFPAALFGSFNKDVIMTSFRNPVRNMIFNILPKNIQGRARALSIGLMLPLALLFAAAFLLIAQQFEDSYYFLIPGLLTSLAYIYFSLRMNKAYVRTLVQHLREQVYIPQDILATGIDKKGAELLEALKQNIRSADDKLAVSCAKTMIKHYPSEAIEVISDRIRSSNNETADQLIPVIAEQTLQPLRDYMERPDRNPQKDEHLEATILFHLFKHQDPGGEPFIHKALSSANPRLQSAGVMGAYRYPDNKHKSQAYNTWLNMLNGNYNNLLAALELVTLINDVDKDQQTDIINSYRIAYINLLTADNTPRQIQALKSLKYWEHGEFDALNEVLVNLFKSTDPYLRAEVINCSHLLAFGEYMHLLIHAFEDGHALVRQSAMNTLLRDNPNTETIARQWLLNNDSYTTPRAQQTMLQYLLKKGVPHKLMREMSETKAEMARLFYDAYHVIKSHQKNNSATYLITSTLKERVIQTCELLLVILEQLDDPEIICVAKAAINSADEQIIASACEALKNMRNSKIADLLVDVLQDNIELKPKYTLRFTNVQQVLNWCKSQDEWLHDCAIEGSK